MSDWYDRAQVIPGRSSTRSKEPGRLYPLGAGPHFARSAHGSRIFGDDDREYLDTICALGAISVGYQMTPPFHRRDDYGVCSLPYVNEIVAAELILEDIAPWADYVRHVRTGSEATHGALVVAQQATGRRPYMRLVGSYHGWHDCWRLEAREARWFDVGEVPERPELEECCAVFIEPPRWQKYSRAWVQEVVDAAHMAGCLVVFDEMIAGGRWAVGGAGELWGIEPDMACFGKAIGNGAPVAAIVGGAVLNEHGNAVSGTYGGHEGSMRAIIATLDAYRDKPVIDTMLARGEAIRQGVSRELGACGLSAYIEGTHPAHQRIVITDDPEGLGLQLSAKLAERGIVSAPYSINTMYCHTAADVAMFVEAVGEGMHELAKDGGS